MAGDLQPGDRFTQPGGTREARQVTRVTWTTGDDDVTGGGAVEIASVPAADPGQRPQHEVFAADDELEAAP
jgi:hypothetical protein